MKNRLPNVHPGEVLLEELLRPMGISQNRLAGEPEGKSAVCKAP